MRRYLHDITQIDGSNDEYRFKPTWARLLHNRYLKKSTTNLEVYKVIMFWYRFLEFVTTFNRYTNLGVGECRDVRRYKYVGGDVPRYSYVSGNVPRYKGPLYIRTSHTVAFCGFYSHVESSFHL
jgi:hypothetical protein